MDDRASRVFTGLSVLVVLWIAVYWLWEPGGARVTVAASPTPIARPDSPVPATAPTKPEPTPIVRAPVRQDPPAGVQHPPTVTPPEFRSVSVRDGDTFEKIAARELGDASLWTAIARANPLRDPRRLRRGQEIRVPVDPGNVQGRPAAATRLARAAPAPEPQRSPQPEAVPTHTVRSGDTLSGIAKSHYGSTVHARWIYENNRDVLHDMDSLSLGQSLRLPPLPSPD